MATYRTVAAPLTHEIDKIKGSRFIADVAPAHDDADAMAVVQRVRDREAGANHHCWAFVLADGRALSSDDGEPGGTAGEPIRRHIGGSGLVDLVVVVTRWFGGTKLGMGGLVRAYGGAASAALSLVPVVERPVVRTFDLTHPYDLSGQVESVLSAFDAAVLDADYGAAVTLRVAVAEEAGPAFAAAVREATAGRVDAAAHDVTPRR